MLLKTISSLVEVSTTDKGTTVYTFGEIEPFGNGMSRVKNEMVFFSKKVDLPEDVKLGDKVELEFNYFRDRVDGQRYPVDVVILKDIKKLK